VDSRKYIWRKNFKKLNSASPHQSLSLEIHTKNIYSDFEFKTIKMVGQISKTFNYFKLHDSPFELVVDEIAWRLLGNFEITDGVVKPTVKNYHLAVNKFDFPRVLPKNQLWDLALEYTYRYLSRYIPKRKPKYEDLYMDYSTSPGYPFNIYWKTKSDVPESLVEKDLCSPFENYYWLLSMKREKLLKSQIIDDFKMRSFMMPPMSLLMRMKKYSQNFNEDLKIVPWSAYGFNWHYTGFHKVLRKFLKYVNINEYDAKYWDKRFPLKEECFKMRLRFLDLLPQELDEFNKIAASEIQPKIILPTGEIIKLKSGQCSGSENTTSDNTIGHIMIIMYEAISGYFNINKLVPTLDQILDNVENVIYSDDVIQGVSEEFKFMCDPFKKKIIFEQFGLGIDPYDTKKWKLHNTIFGVSFLGMTVTLYDEYLVPYYEYDKVKNSSVIIKDKEKPKEQLIRFISMLSLLTFTTNYNSYRDFIIEYASQTMQTVSLPTQNEMLNIELGRDVN
jgi:hypothetical protein